MGWDVSKNVQNGDTKIPLEVSGDEDAAAEEAFEITSAAIEGFGSLRRSKSASFENEKVRQKQLKSSPM